MINLIAVVAVNMNAVNSVSGDATFMMQLYSLWKVHSAMETV